MIATALDALLDRLTEAEALLLEPQEMFNTCLLGVAERADGMLVAAYDSAQVVAEMQLANHWDYDEAREFFDFNVLNSYVGEKSPVFIDSLITE